jgi:hypothetical protein
MLAQVPELRQPSRNYLSIALAIVVSGVLISTSLFLTVGQPPKMTTTTFTTTDTQTVTTTSTVALQPVSGACLKEVPGNSVFSSYSNSTSEGYAVTYPNGTRALFPLNFCPIPVTPENYRIDSIIEANPKFIAAENGSVYEATNACNCSALSANISNSTGRYAVFNFDLYGSQRIYPCGPGSYWSFKQLGLLLVTIPINATGGLQFSNTEIQSGSTNIFMCTTTT